MIVMSRNDDHPVALAFDIADQISAVYGRSLAAIKSEWMFEAVLLKVQAYVFKAADDIVRCHLVFACSSFAAFVNIG